MAVGEGDLGVVREEVGRSKAMESSEGQC